MTRPRTVCECGSLAVKAGWCNACYIRLRRRGTTKYFREELVLAPADPAFLAWAAGLFEGEGSIGITRAYARNLGALLVSIPNTQQDLVDPFFERWGGSLRADNQTNELHSVIYRWRVRATRAQAFLREVQPYIRSQKYKEKVLLALAYQEQKSSGRPPAGVRSEEYAALQHSYYAAMRSLNERGRARLHADTGTPLDAEVSER